MQSRTLLRAVSCFFILGLLTHGLVATNLSPARPDNLTTQFAPNDSLYHPQGTGIQPITTAGLCLYQSRNLPENRFYGIRTPFSGYGLNGYMNGVDISLTGVVGKFNKDKGGFGFNVIKNGLCVGILASFAYRINGVSLATLFHGTNQMNGVSISGIINATEKANGLWVGGIYNGTEYLNGLSLGLVQIIEKNANGAMVGGANLAQQIHGVELGLWNHLESTSHGVQLGIFNQAADFRGVQIGLWNVHTGKDNIKRQYPLIYPHF